MKYNKYGNDKVRYKGHNFDSKKEYHRFLELELLQSRGFIKDLELQKTFVLIPNQYDERGKLVERQVSYKADFVYYDTTEKKKVVEDVKGYKTDIYRIKRKLMYYRYGIRIQEI